MYNDLILSLDIGGTAVKSGMFSSSTFKVDKTLLEIFPSIILKEKNFESIKSALFKSINYGLMKYRPISIAISTTGSVSKEGILLSGPDQLIDYKMVNWCKIVKERFDSIQDVYVTNDGKAATWAEYCYHTNLEAVSNSHVHFVIGTGVGGSVIVNGELITGDSDEAGFMGHTRVTDSLTAICGCGKQGCLETIVSSPGLVYEYNKLSHAPLSTFKDFLSAIENKDKNAQNVLIEACNHLGGVIAVLANALNPSYITFGGGVILGIREALTKINEEYLFIKCINSQLVHCAFNRTAKTTKLKYAALGNNGGMIGASLLSINSKKRFDAEGIKLCQKKK